MTDRFSYQAYKKDAAYSYALGAYIVLDLIQCCSHLIQRVVLHSKYAHSGELSECCRQHGIVIEQNDRFVERVSQKQNCYVVAVVQKIPYRLDPARSHIVLVNPDDQGNVGTIARTAVGLGYADLALIAPAADIYHPKTIRASMGAVFHIRHQYFSSIEEYTGDYGARALHPFMLEGSTELTEVPIESGRVYSLIFGNEGSGLDASYQTLGSAIRIPQTAEVDSLNLSAAVGIGAFWFAAQQGKRRGILDVLE